MIPTDIFQVSTLHSNLLKNDWELNYLLKRGVSLASLHKFEVGYFDATKYSEYYRRIMFPLHDAFGEFLAYQGRAHPNEDTNKPDYRKFMITSGYNKNQNLYGLYQNVELISKYGFAFVVEGPFDVMALSEVGLPAVATLGAAFAEPQALLLRRYVQRAYKWYDEDKAGRVGSADAHIKASKVGLELMNRPYVGGSAHDPADTWRYTPELLWKMKKELLNDNSLN
jgi:DNA primase